MVAGAEIQGDERQPDHTGGIHREPWKMNGLLSKKLKKLPFDSIFIDTERCI